VAAVLPPVPVPPLPPVAALAPPVPLDEVPELPQPIAAPKTTIKPNRCTPVIDCIVSPLAVNRRQNE